MKFIVIMLALLISVEAAAADNREPLVTIRFNQTNVYYEKSLYRAVVKAAEVKPGVMFDVVASSPSGASRAEEATKDSLGHVLATLNEMGVPKERIAVNTLTNQPVASPEVRVFVR